MNNNDPKKIKPLNFVHFCVTDKMFADKISHVAKAVCQEMEINLPHGLFCSTPSGKKKHYYISE